jgi:hypothetical protein
MKHEFKIAAAVGVAVILAGCEPYPLTPYEETDQAMATMAGKYLDAAGNLLGGVTVTPWDDVPVVGDATYNGYVGGDLTGGDLDGRTLVGELTLNVDFATNDLTGFADNFYDDTNVQYAGSLDAGSSLINRGGGGDQLTPTLEGDLIDGIVLYDTSIALSGNFIGATPGVVGGYADGDVGDSVLLGVFIAEQ